MRVVVGSALIVRASSAMWEHPSLHTLVMPAFLAAFGLSLISGLWTPIVGALAAIIQISQIMMMTGDWWVPLLLGTMCIALAMLGPGLWSIDARLFGWKRVEPPPRRRDSISY